MSVPLAVPEGVGKLLERAPDELGLLPQVGCEEAVGVGDGREGGLEGVLEGLGRAGRRRVGVLDTGELEETLDGGRSDDRGTAGSREKLVRGARVSTGASGCLACLGTLTRTVTEPHLPLSLVGRE